MSLGPGITKSKEEKPWDRETVLLGQGVQPDLGQAPVLFVHYAAAARGPGSAKRVCHSARSSLGKNNSGQTRSKVTRSR